VKLALCLTLALILCALTASAAQAAGIYDCGRSDHNYPSLVAQEFKPDEFSDVSCGSAQRSARHRSFTKHSRVPGTLVTGGGHAA
jgi:hypothetical protein